MKLGLTFGYWQQDPTPNMVELAQEAERLGFDSVWTAEAYGSDCFSPLTWLGAHTKTIKLGTGIMQLSARTPVCAAMTALTIDHLTNGRLILGVGVSGPQVVEGWYGQDFRKPLTRTREWLDIFRQVIAREQPVSLDGKVYQLPLQGGMGLGKPLKSITHPLRSHIPVYLGAEGPKNVQLAAEAFDGWMPVFVSPYRMDIFADSLQHRREGHEIAAYCSVNINDDLAAALLPVKYTLALYLGGMGAKDMNFHKNLMGRMGFGDAAEKVQELFYAGKREEAVMAVPDALADEISLSGPKDRIRERLQDWQKSDVTSLLIGCYGSLTDKYETMRFLAEETL
ncbi:LLM class F420-dependent oxidoreductase [Spongiibacter marinus]|uniref:LLM class F420-dependent oxidoreductase n=1 Tax=Spongiibacter marinus TaxID=354246 RepID=UPI0035BE9466